MRTQEEIDAATCRVRAAISAQLRANRQRRAARRWAAGSVVAALLALALGAFALWAR